MKLSLLLLAAAVAASPSPDFDNPLHPPPDDDPSSALLLGCPLEDFGDTDPSFSSDGMRSSIMDTDSTNVGGGGLLVRYVWFM